MVRRRDQSEAARRLKRLQASLKRSSLDAFIVFDRYNAFYLTEFQASLSYLLVTPRSARLLVDGRYIESATKSVRHCKVELFKDIGTSLRDWKSELGLQRIGFEGSIPWNVARLFTEQLKEAELIEAGRLILDLRVIKSSAEVKRIESAARTADDVYATLIEHARPGMTEIDLRNVVRSEADRLGAEGESFESIVATGASSSMPHYRPSSRRLRKGDPLLIDMGIRLNHYCSDMTRVVGLGGKDAPPEFRTVYKAVLEAEKAAITAIRPGVRTSRLHEIAVNRLKKHKLARYFTHGLGHGVGLEIHEAPTLNAKSKDVLRAGMVITIEPGVYLPGKFGVRIEDLILVTRTGHRVLSHSPKAFRILKTD